MERIFLRKELRNENGGSVYILIQTSWNRKEKCKIKRVSRFLTKEKKNEHRMCFHEGRIFLRKGKKDLEAMKIFMNEENEMNVLRFFLKKKRGRKCVSIKGGFFPPKKKLERIRIMKKKNS